MAANDPVLERIATYAWPRGSVQACQVRGGYILTSTRTGAPVARLRQPFRRGRFHALVAAPFACRRQQPVRAAFKGEHLAPNMAEQESKGSWVSRNRV